MYFFNLMHKAKKERLGFYWLSFGCVCLFSFLLILIGILYAWAWDFPAERTLPLPQSPGPPLNSRAELEKRPIAHHARDQVKITNFD